MHKFPRESGVCREFLSGEEKVLKNGIYIHHISFISFHFFENIMKPIVLFVPYYGSVPPYMSAFVHTVSKQSSFLDVYLFSDKKFLDEVSSCCDIPSNVRLIDLSWEDLCCLIYENKHLAKPFSPYKLCDYRTAYGYIFEEYCVDYEYWGYCDVDILMGDVQGFLERNDFRKYERVGRFGHFTIYKNNETNRTFFMEKFDGQRINDNFSFACTTTYPCHIDEIGSNILFKKLFGADLFLEDNFVLNTAIGCRGCHTWNHRFSSQILTWEDGHTYSYSHDENSQIIKEEAMYIHFMVQKEVKSFKPFSDSLLLTPEKIVPFNLACLEEYLSTIGVPETVESYQNRLSACKKIIRKQRMSRLIREIKTVGLFRGFRNFVLRFNAISQLIEHRLF